MPQPLQVTASAALFDMDGTLVNSTAVVEELWQRFCDEWGIDPGELIPASHGVRTPDTVRRFLPDASPAETAEIVAELDRRELATLEGVVEVPGAAALLAAIDLPWAVVTSAPRELAVRRMAAAGLPVPEVMVTSDDTERGKPDPEGYLRAAALLGIEPADCVVLEDAGPGVRAAVDSGARVVVVGDLDSPLTAGLDRVPDLTALRLSRAH